LQSVIWPGAGPAQGPVRGLRGFGLRAAAMLVDLALLAGLEFGALTLAAFVWLLACAPAGAVPADAAAWVDWRAGDILDALFMALGVGYFAGSTARWGQTAGKKLLGLRVVRADGGPVGGGQALFRETLGRLAAGFLLGLGYLWAAWDAGGQAWHDKLAGTLVVRVR
jgi:uncharacterized RDD family membrane protein YckC